MVVTAESTQERGWSAGKSEIAAAHGEAAEAVRRKKKAWPDAGTELRGVRRRANGKYAARIWDPSQRSHVSLGTFLTAKDASKAYDSAAFALHAAGVVARKRTAARPDDKTEFRGVFRLPNDKYVAQIWDPSRRAQVCLGTFDAAEEAARAYDAAAAAGTHDAMARAHEAAAVKMPCVKKATCTGDSRTGFHGVCRRPSGKYTAEFKSKGNARWLGSFDTAEEAARAYDSVAIKLHGAKARPNFKVDGGLGLKKATYNCRTGFRGVQRQRSGKYRARLWDAATQKMVCLGTFGTPEDAAKAHDAAVAVRLPRVKKATCNSRTTGFRGVRRQVQCAVLGPSATSSGSSRHLRQC
jgi:hypothetical protein